MVTLAQALRAGLTRDQVRQLCRSGRWQRLVRSCFVPTAELSDAALHRARVRAAVTSLGPGAFAVFDTALELYGIAGLRRASQVHVSVAIDRPRSQRALAPWLVVHQLTVGPGDITVVAGVRATSPLQNVSDVILQVDRYPAVSVLDSALNQGRLTSAQLAMIPSLICGRRGAVAARVCLAEADGRAQSPLETRTRLRCVDGSAARRVAARDPRRRRLSARNRRPRLARPAGDRRGRRPGRARLAAGGLRRPPPSEPPGQRRLDRPPLHLVGHPPAGLHPLDSPPSPRRRPLSSIMRLAAQWIANGPANPMINGGGGGGQ